MSEQIKPSIMALLRKFIDSYPMLFGALLAFLAFVAIIGMDAWFPRVGEAWGRNNANVRSVFFTVAFFTLWISQIWQWRRRNTFVFWISVCIFLSVHGLCVFLYSTRVHPLSLREWIYLMALESFGFVFALDWITRRSSKQVTQP